MSERIRFRKTVERWQRRKQVHFARMAAPFAGDRSLPDFLIVGAMKSGTSSLYEYLIQHPAILSARVKEVHYFDQPWNYRFGENWYRYHFPTHSELAATSKEQGIEAVTGEATPSMYIPGYARNAAQLTPEAKIIVILRNPVERAHSHYLHQLVRPRREELPFWEALSAEELRIGRVYERSRRDFNEVSADLFSYSYAGRGRYIEQLEEWTRHFAREQILILNYDELAQDASALCNKVSAFLNLPKHAFDTRIRHNVSHSSRTMSQRCRDHLTEHFRPYNRRLFEFLGEDWGWPT